MAVTDPGRIESHGPHGHVGDLLEHAIAAIDDAADASDYRAKTREIRAVLYWLRRAADCRACAREAHEAGLTAEGHHMANLAGRHVERACSVIAGEDPEALAKGAAA